MSRETIADFFCFVIFYGAICVSLSACGFVASKTAEPARPAAFSQPVVVSRIKSKDLSESSGIAASRCNPNVLWSHNDSGNDETLFAIDTAGMLLGEWKVTNARNTDWEDIAAYKDKAGRCFIYVGDTGDNKLQRTEHSVFRVSEPVVVPSGPDQKGDNHRSETAAAEKLTFRYPDRNHDAETLMVEPVSGNIYVLTKQLSGPSGVYRLKPDFDREGIQTAEHVADITVPAIPNGYLTGGDIAPDGKHVIVCDYTQAYEYVLPNGDANFDDVWKQEPVVVELGKRSGGESIGYSVDGTALYATSEGKDPPLIKVDRRQ